MSQSKRGKIDIVGPVCESGDFFALGREMPEVHEGDLIAIMSAGAYGFVMASNYNSRPLPAEALRPGRLLEPAIGAVQSPTRSRQRC